jgi:hypothetical protein
MEKLEKLKKSLDNKFIPDNMKDKIRAEIKKLESEIKTDETMTATEVKEEVKEIEEKVEKALEVAEVKEEIAEAKAEEKKEKAQRKPREKKATKSETKTQKVEPKATAKKKSVFSLAKEIRKDGESWQDAKKRASKMMKSDTTETKKKVRTETDKLLAMVRRNKEYKKLAGSSDLPKDAQRRALPRGKRVSADGNVYYENRANRVDVGGFKNAYLENGGGVDGIIELKPLELIPLSSQLNRLSGYNWTFGDWESEDGGKPSTMPNSVIVNVHTKQKFRLSPFKIYEGIDHYNNKPLYRVEDMSEDGEYVGEWYKTRQEAEDELREMFGNSYDNGGSVDRERFNKFISSQINYIISLKTISQKREPIQNLINNMDDYSGEEIQKRITKDNLKYALQQKTVSKINEVLRISLNALKYADGGTIIGTPETPLARGLGMDYTGLVGETGAMSSGELFAGGGYADKGVYVETLDEEIDLSEDGRVRARKTQEGKNLSYGELREKHSASPEALAFAEGGSLGNHGLKQGDQIIKTMSGGVQKVKTKSGDIVYVNLANGYRGAEPPLPFDGGGRLKSALMRDRNNVNYSEDYEVRYSKDKSHRSGYTKPKMSRTQFEEETFEFFAGGGRLKKGRYSILGEVNGEQPLLYATTDDKSKIKSLVDMAEVDFYELTGKKHNIFVTDEVTDDEVYNYGNGGRTRERKYVNHSQDYEVRYSKDKPHRRGYGYAEGGFMTDPNFGDFQNQVYAGGGVTKNYINRNQLNTITIKKGDQKLTYKVSDVYNGAYKLEDGGNLEKTAFYVSKRNVVKVQLKDGKDVKVANGYWIKKGAKPIHTSKYDDGGMTEKEFMQKEINSQKEIEKGKVFKKYRVNVYENSFPFVEPLMTDNLVEAVNFAKKTIEEQRKYRASSKDLFAEISEFTPIEKRDNVRYAYYRIGSLSEEDLKSSKYDDGGGIDDFSLEKLKKKEIELAINGYKKYTEEKWKGYDYFSEKYAVNELAELELDLRRLNDGKISPTKIIGSGYKNPKKVAQEWLQSQIKKQKSIIETNGLSNKTNHSNFRHELVNAKRENIISEVKFNKLLDESNEIIESLGETYSYGGFFDDGGQLEMKFAGGGKLETKIQKKVDEVNALIEKAVDSDGDPLMVVDATGTWEEPMQYKPIVYKNGRLYIEYFEPYSGKTQKEVVNKSNVEFDGYPMLLDIAKMYRKALKEKGVSYAGGGKTTFKEKATAIAKNFEGKKVKPKYQKEYGKTYDKTEAKEVGNKIAGSQKAKYDSKMSGGGSTKRGGAMQLAKQIRKDGESWQSALKRANEEIRNK